MNAFDLQQALAGRRVLLAGGGGQVGVALRQIMPGGVELQALDRGALDITDRKAVTEAVGRIKPDWVINAAAYTAVDKAESEPELAFVINRDGAAHLAQAAAEANARMVQISTDYVFDGEQARPYRPDDAVNPINVYGESKLAGEVATRGVLGERALILRTAWVYSPHGRNFLTTMLRLMRERDELKVVEDQVGTPTSASSLARVILLAMAREVTGTHHWTDAGATSWYDFACAIGELAEIAGFTFGACRIAPIPTSDYPTPARRPTSSLLDKQSMRQAIGEDGVQWKKALRQVVSQMVDLS
ncbi:MAG TPA: dTDP-4-dehydrorhamnose reductase [Thioalkalivibrio sp.]|nr:dTDP-4-dehydrorhamnose reductase [Thioalkalivibrio sp.]